ncbi:peptidoglycan binding domain protein [Oesophagostomum dentatum]|uniref:Peptidoglycan binding domain protein n=1 Tax=Oesophagostomum dentatum TaxID=61180 RepID=A0A0B1TH86_OESDE|nr:peptidoglycan binding domain protein [Oesophagostomum dentatum]
MSLTQLEQKTEEKERINSKPVLEYLHRYGYLSTNTPSLHELRSALRLFQEVVGVEPTGEVDPATVAATRLPRCAHRDTVRPLARSKRFALPGISKWDKKHFTGLHELTLKWFVSDYTNDIPKATVRQTIQKAFQIWAKQVNDRNLPKVTFHFEEATSKEDADINILWAEGAHGDEYEFDGVAVERNILAHTFFPGHAEPLNGDIHFDDAETWVTDPAAATSYNRPFFPYVLMHEIGHALGLQHAKKPEAIMSPTYKSTPLDEIKLDMDDKCAINWNYGMSLHQYFF